MSRIVLAHHWMKSMRGGEKVLEQMCLLFPEAPIYTLVADREVLSPILQSRAIRTSWLQHLSRGTNLYKKLLPLFPRAVGGLKVGGMPQVILSSDASLIKGLSYPAGALQVCYCHSPPRYLWDLQGVYMQSSESGGALGRAVLKGVTPYVREFDRKAAQRVDYFIANSSFVQTRIRDYYGRDSEVIHPPVAVDDFIPGEGEPEDFYLIVSQLVGYKRIDVAVEAFNKLKSRLIIIGEGPERQSLEKRANGNITFLGSLSSEALKDYYRRCRAFVFPEKTRSSNNGSQVTVASFRTWRGWPADVLPLLARKPRRLPKQVVRAAISQGQITHSQLIWSPEDNAWKQVRDLPHLLPSQKLAPAPTPRMATRALPKIEAAPQPKAVAVPRVAVKVAEQKPRVKVRVAGAGSAAGRGYSEVEPPREANLFKWITIVLAVVILGVLGFNYIMVDQPLMSNLSKTGYSSVPVYAHLGAFVQTTFFFTSSTALAGAGEVMRVAAVEHRQVVEVIAHGHDLQRQHAHAVAIASRHAPL
jgi:hypothetical protein